MPPRLLDLLYVPLVILYLPLLIYQMVVQKKNRRGWRERFGFVKPRIGPNNRPCIWIHAVSLGEVNATRSLMAEIEKRLPAYDVVISATTDTGYAAAREHYPAKYVFRYPLDFSFVVRRVLNRIRPDAIVLIELEVWPNLVALARSRGIPVGIANGRVTEERSMRRFRLPIIRGLARRTFADIAWTAAQNQAYASRFAELGAPSDRVVVTGTMKYDTAVIADGVPGDDALADALGIDPDKPLLVAGSTGPGEERLLLQACTQLREDHPDLQVALIPRKPERFGEVARLCEADGLACIRRSRHPDPPGPTAGAARCRDAAGRAEGDGDGTSDPGAPGPASRPRSRLVSSRSLRRGVSSEQAGEARMTVILGDTVGELRKFYALADVVFVGRSLVPMGGSDLIEVAGLGRPMCFGPHVENFADVAEQLTSADAAVQLRAADQLVPTLRRFLDDTESAAAVGRRAQDVVRRNTGATKKAVNLLCESLGRRADHPASSISTERLR